MALGHLASSGVDHKIEGLPLGDHAQLSACYFLDAIGARSKSPDFFTQFLVASHDFQVEFLVMLELGVKLLRGEVATRSEPISTLERDQYEKCDQAKDSHLLTPPCVLCNLLESSVIQVTRVRFNAYETIVLGSSFRSTH